MKPSTPKDSSPPHPTLSRQLEHLNLSAPGNSRRRSAYDNPLRFTVSTVRNQNSRWRIRESFCDGCSFLHREFFRSLSMERNWFNPSSVGVCAAEGEPPRADRYRTAHAPRPTSSTPATIFPPHTERNFSTKLSDKGIICFTGHRLGNRIVHI